MKNYNIAPKPTNYKGRLYRSRLEARWAAMFDLLGWMYEYEAIDLKGWMPDFVLYGESNVMVEIKPYDLIDKYLVERIFNAAKNHNSIILFESWQKDSIGFEVCREDQFELVGGWWSLQIKDYPDGTYDIGSPNGLFDGMLFDKPQYRKFFIQKSDFEKLWNEAGNQVMYMNPED